jgi:hypothetical protein
MAYFDQEQLGWEQALQGRLLSKRWGEAQDQYYKDRFPDQHNTGNTWTTKVISTLWEYAKAIWQERNFAYHGVDNAESHIKCTDDLNDLIVRSFQLDSTHVAFQPTPLLKKPIETILEQPGNSKRAWLRWMQSSLATDSESRAIRHQGPHNNYGKGIPKPHDIVAFATKQPKRARNATT